MSEVQQAFEVSEMGILSWKCPDCESMVLFSVDTEDRFGIPSKCPTCARSMEAEAQAFSAYRKFYRAVVERKMLVQLRSNPVTE
jgi:DNA-directed RNA polymerase subunit M/transcription elongation factor TFIIS